MHRSRARRNRRRSASCAASHAPTPHAAGVPQRAQRSRDLPARRTLRRRLRSHTLRTVRSPASASEAQVQSRPVHVQESPANRGICQRTRWYLPTSPRPAVVHMMGGRHDALRRARRLPVPPTSLDRPYRVVPAAGADYPRTPAATKPENRVPSPDGYARTRAGGQWTTIDDESTAADLPPGVHLALPIHTFLRLDIAVTRVLQDV